MTEKMQKLEKADGQSMDIVENNIEQLKELFPEVFAEGKINFDRLQEVLGNYVVTDEDHYNFTWHGKRAAGRLAQTPSTGTLRPCPQESVDWDKTQNLFIEGDNLEVLKLLQKSYHRQIKMIYIDPPYNTGNDFVYEDDFKDGIKNYLAVTGQLDDEGKKKGTNSSAAGRYHTNWLNMMYPRLKLARNLLRDDGVIFISIDDNEKSNLKKLCDDIFGENNFLGELVWKKKYIGGKHANHIVDLHEYILVFSKNVYDLHELLMERPANELEKFSLEDEYVGTRGKHYIRPLKSNLGRRETLIYPIEMPDGTSIETQWMVSKETLGNLIEDGRILFKQKRDGTYNIYRKYYQNDNDGSVKVPSLIEDVSNADGKVEIKNLFGVSEGREIPFDNPKPTGLLKYLINPSVYDDSIVLDFFSGSCSTADAVMQINAEKSMKLSYIMVQLPELTPEGSEGKKLGYNNIADISKDRIRLATKKIKEENPLFSGDLGFKVFKLDTSNIKTWEAGFDTLKDDLIAAADYIKQDRSSDDIVFELLLKYGLDLTVPIETRMIAGKKVYSIGLGALVVCLDNEVPMETVNGIGALKEELKPEIMRVVFKDSGFKDDVVKTNALQTLKRFGIEDIKSL